MHLDGEDITKTPVEAMVRKGMAHVPEGRGVIAELTVEENLRLGGLFRKGADPDERDRGGLQAVPVARQPPQAQRPHAVRR